MKKIIFLMLIAIFSINSVEAQVVYYPSTDTQKSLLYWKAGDDEFKVVHFILDDFLIKKIQDEELKEVIDLVFWDALNNGQGKFVPKAMILYLDPTFTQYIATITYYKDNVFRETTYFISFNFKILNEIESDDPKDIE